MPALPASSVSTRFPFNLRAATLTCFPCAGFAGFSCSINSYRPFSLSLSPSLLQATSASQLEIHEHSFHPEFIICLPAFFGKECLAHIISSVLKHSPLTLVLSPSAPVPSGEDWVSLHVCPGWTPRQWGQGTWVWCVGVYGFGFLSLLSWGMPSALLQSYKYSAQASEVLW